MVKLLSLLALLPALALAGCGAAGTTQSTPANGEVRASDPRAAAVAPPADATALRAGNSAFAGALLDELARGNTTVALSPYSISAALAMTYGGARGETATQIATALRFHLDPPALGAAFNALEQSLGAASGPGATLSIANALYGQRGTAFRQPFLSLLARYYGAGMRIVDFAQNPDGARTAINDWVAAQTKGKITKLLAPGQVDPMTQLVLVNAIYLNAHWASPFSAQATEPATFHAPVGTVTVPTMHQDGTFGYLRGRGYDALELPYRGGRLAFDVLLPDSGGMPALLTALAARGPLALLHGLAPAPVALALPKLTLRTHVELSDPLRELGMRLAFTPGQADLSGIAGLPGELSVTTIVHEAYIRVDEAGTEAAAATGVVVRATAAPTGEIIFNVDRPFVFVLRDVQTGAVVFMGVVYHP
jgi:serpin B